MARVAAFCSGVSLVSKATYRKSLLQSYLKSYFTTKFSKRLGYKNEFEIDYVNGWLRTGEFCRTKS